MIAKLMLIAAGGGLGALSRYGLAGLAHRMFGTGFPYGTFAVNCLGCLLFGALWGVVELKAPLGPELRAALFTGFLGAFTTFSTYIFESAGLFRDGQWTLGLVNVGGQIVVGLGLFMAGMALARLAAA